MRRLLVAGNWKMNLDRSGAASLASAVVAGCRGIDDVDLAIFPAFVHLDAVRAAAVGSKLAYGAQNMYHEPNGAFTGEISASMLVDLGCRYVILGHSERRHILGESDETVYKKTQAALAAGLTPVVCVGELLAEREAGHTGTVIRRQFAGSLGNLPADQIGRVVIAYEPVWAIGTGKVATPEQAEEVHKDLRKILSDRYNATIAEGIRILYGGSVKASNAAELLGRPNVDGGSWGPPA